MNPNARDTGCPNDGSNPGGCSYTIRGISAILSLGCFAGAVLAGGVLLLGSMNIRLDAPAHILVVFMGGATILISLTAAVRLGIYPSRKGLLWFVAAAFVFWLFHMCFSLSGTKGIFH